MIAMCGYIYDACRIGDAVVLRRKKKYGKRWMTFRVVDLDKWKGARKDAQAFDLYYTEAKLGKEFDAIPK